MELRQLEYFVAVAEEGGFTRAARRVHVAQPGVSAQIRRLEAELGQPLFERGERTVRLTAAGAAALPLAREALAAVRGVSLAVDEVAGLLRGRVAVGMVTACGAADVPALLAGFHERHPGIDIALREDDSNALLSALAAGRLDVALAGLVGEPPAGIETLTLIDDALALGVPSGHPLAGRRRLTAAELQEWTLVTLPEGTGLRTALDGLCAREGVHPRVGLEASAANVMLQLAAQGLGVAVAAESMIAATPGLTLVPLLPRTRSRLDFAWRAGSFANPAARALVEHLCTAVPAVTRAA